MHSEDTAQQLSVKNLFEAEVQELIQNGVQWRWMPSA